MTINLREKEKENKNYYNKEIDTHSIEILCLVDVE